MSESVIDCIVGADKISYFCVVEIKYGMRISFIALKVTRYSDTQSILTAYSRELGRVSFAVTVGKGKGAARLRALTMPLGLVECDTDMRPGRDVLPLRQARPLVVLSDMHSNPVKQMMAMFLAEVLSFVLWESVPDPHLYDYIAASARYLDGISVSEVANFHICFLIHLGRLLGIEPDVSTYSPGTMLDMSDGIWRRSIPLHGEVLTSEESESAMRLQRMTYANMSTFRFTREQRARVLDMVLRYYSLHVTSLSGLHSLEILRSMS